MKAIDRGWRKDPKRATHVSQELGNVLIDESLSEYLCVWNCSRAMWSASTVKIAGALYSGEYTPIKNEMALIEQFKSIVSQTSDQELDELATTIALEQGDREKTDKQKLWFIGCGSYIHGSYLTWSQGVTDFSNVVNRVMGQPINFKGADPDSFIYDERGFEFKLYCGYVNRDEVQDYLSGNKSHVK